MSPTLDERLTHLVELRLAEPEPLAALEDLIAQPVDAVSVGLVRSSAAPGMEFEDTTGN